MNPDREMRENPGREMREENWERSLSDLKLRGAAPKEHLYILKVVLLCHFKLFNPFLVVQQRFIKYLPISQFEIYIYKFFWKTNGNITIFFFFKYEHFLINYYV